MRVGLRAVLSALISSCFVVTPAIAADAEPPTEVAASTQTAEDTATATTAEAKRPLISDELTSRVGGTVIDGGEVDVPVTWTRAGSPYYVNLPVQVVATLTIEAGVVVVPRGTAFVVRGGALVMEGTRSDPIVALPPQQAGTPVPFAVGGPAGGTLQMRHVLVSGYNPFTSGLQVNAAHARFYNEQPSPYLFAGGPEFTTVNGEVQRIAHTELVNVRAIETQTAVITDSRVGATRDQTTLILGPESTLSDNVISPSRQYSLALRGDADLAAQGNWWTSSNRTEIARWIYDGADASHQDAYVVFEPYLMAPPAAATFEPLPPEYVNASPGVDYSARVDWESPVSDGGAPITGYEIVAFPGQHRVEVGADTTEAVVPNLDPEQEYVFSVTAQNSVGSSEPGTYRGDELRRGTTPAAPQVQAQAGDQSINVSWTAAPQVANYPVTGFSVVATPEVPGVERRGQSVDASKTAVTLSGLTNGVRYSIEVVARNDLGPSAPGRPEPVILTPAGLPGPVTGLLATRGDQQATIAWQPADGNGAQITKYTIHGLGADLDVDVSQNSATVFGLSNGQRYEVSVTATSPIGSSTSGPVAFSPAGLPSSSAPVSARPGDGAIDVTWAAASGNGEPVSSYTVTTVPASTSKTVVASQTSTRLIGVRNGVSYRVEVVANNALGAGTKATSVAVTPAARPGTVTGLRVKVAGKKKPMKTVTFSWNPAPANGSAVLDYVIRVNSRNYVVRAPATKLVVRLRAGQHTATVFARNKMGSGLAGKTVRFRVRP